MGAKFIASRVKVYHILKIKMNTLDKYEQYVILNQIENLKSTFNSDEIFNISFTRYMFDITSFIFNRFARENLKYIEDTKWGQLYSHMYNGFTFDFFLTRKDLDYVFMYKVDNDTITIHKMEYSWILAMDFDEIKMEYYGKKYKTIKEI